MDPMDTSALLPAVCTTAHSPLLASASAPCRQPRRLCRQVRCPITRQLLGSTFSNYGAYGPSAADVPLSAPTVPLPLSDGRLIRHSSPRLPLLVSLTLRASDGRLIWQVSLVALFDHEEVGSVSTTGAASPFLRRQIERIWASLEADLEAGFFGLIVGPFCAVIFLPRRGPQFETAVTNAELRSSMLGISQSSAAASAASAAALSHCEGDNTKRE